MDKELELEAEKHVKTISKFPKWNEHDASIFIAGATSKWVEKQKLEFAIEQLKRFREATFGEGVDVIKELEQKLSEL